MEEKWKGEEEDANAYEIKEKLKTLSIWVL